MPAALQRVGAAPAALQPVGRRRAAGRRAPVPPPVRAVASSAEQPSDKPELPGAKLVKSVLALGAAFSVGVAGVETVGGAAPAAAGALTPLLDLHPCCTCRLPMPASALAHTLGAARRRWLPAWHPWLPRRCRLQRAAP